MRYKQLIVSAMLMLAIGLTGLQAQTMNVKQSIGTQTAYDLNSISKMDFSSGNINIIKTDNSSDSYAISDLRYINFEDFTTGIKDQGIAKNHNLSTYPNPVLDQLNVNLSGTVNKGAIINIFNLEGKVVKSLSIKKSGLVSVNISQLPKGIYICRYNNGTDVQTAKIVKQ